MFCQKKSSQNTSMPRGSSDIRLTIYAVDNYTAKEKTTFFLFAIDISMTLWYMWCPGSKNNVTFAELAVVFEIIQIHII